MGNNDDLSIRFSNITYSSKQEVSDALNVANIDEIWNKIILYRSNFNRSLLLRNIDRTPYSVTLTPSINDKISVVERKLTKAIIKYSRLSDEDMNIVKKNEYAKCLRKVGNKYNLDLTDEFLKQIVENNISTLSPSELLIANYYHILQYVEKHYVDPIDHNFLIEIYQMFTGVDDIDNPYRNENIEEYVSGSSGNDYSSAPVEKIIPMMEELFAMINNDIVSPIVKAIMSYFFITHIKPFDVYSEEIGIIFMKNVLAHNDYEEVVSLISLESLLCDNEDRVNQILNEVRTTNDITYLVSYCLPLMENMVNELLKSIEQVSAIGIQNEYYNRATPKVRRKENLPVIDINEPLSNVASTQVNFEMNVSLPTLPVGLDERDAAKIEEHLIEVYPTLKRGQAHFYSRHCTIGKYYTIAQYKKLTGCAYETARTSMDGLVDLGFYRKEKLNNKFIYTPVPRRQ